MDDHATRQSRAEIELAASIPSFFIAPPYGWRHPVTGRVGWQPDPMLLAFGQYIKRSRRMLGMSQQRLGDAAQVDQGQISRLERALAPAMNVERVVRLSGVLGRALPLGYCPHEHWCQWQPAPTRPPDQARVTSAADKLRYLDILLGTGADPASTNED